MSLLRVLLAKVACGGEVDSGNREGGVVNGEPAGAIVADDPMAVPLPELLLASGTYIVAQ